MRNKIKTALYIGLGALAFGGYLKAREHFPDRLVEKNGIIYRVYEKDDYNAINRGGGILGLTIMDEDKDGKVDVTRSWRTPRYFAGPGAVRALPGNGKPTLDDQILFDEVMSEGEKE